MARPQSIDDGELLARLSVAFRDVGYAGASMEMLSAATGLKKASLYHRFPGGKRQMAEEVLAAALNWYESNVLQVLRGADPPAARIEVVARRLDSFYGAGEQACLLNMLTSPRQQDGPFSAAIRLAFASLIDAFAVTLRDAGHSPQEADRRAQRMVMLLQGSLVVSRGLGSSEPFQAALKSLIEEIEVPASHRRSDQRERLT